MKLYYAPGTCALAPHIVLEWIGAPYEAERVDPSSDAYRQINPLGMVPALLDGGPKVMTQADAILKYIAAKHPEAMLGAGEGLDAEFEMDETLAFLTGDMHPAFWPFFAPQRYTTKGDADSLTAVRQAAYLRIDRAMLHLDKMLTGTSHVVGGRRSIADPYAFAMVRWTENLPKTWKEYPAISPFMERIYHHPCVVTVMGIQGLKRISS